MNDWIFDATQYNPDQGMAKHPVGKKFPAMVKMTSRQTVKDKEQNAFFSVLFETPAGQIIKNYNLVNDNAQAVDIANRHLTALCHATGVFKLTGQGEALRGSMLMLDVDWQKGQEPTPEKPGGGWVEVSHVYDKNGNEPGKQPVNAPQPQQGQPQGQPQGQWGQQPAQQPQPNGGNGGWGAQGVGTNPNPTPNTGWSQQQPGPGNDKPAWATNK